MKQLWQNKEKIPFWFRSCCVCRWSVPPVPWLCSGCWKKLNSFYLHPRDMIREQGGLTHARLFDWGEENDFFARLFLNSLKKGGPAFIFEKLMQDFLHRFLQVRSLPANTVFIPAPSSHREQPQDHAFSLCHAMSHVAGFAFQNPLLVAPSPQTQIAQKQKSRKERKEIHFDVQKSFSVSNKTLIFVDDILTTGATARSAWKTLGKPPSFIIFTLSWRRFLQEDSRSKAVF